MRVPCKAAQGAGPGRNLLDWDIAQAGEAAKSIRKMMLVRTYLAPSSIHGLGVFAAEPVEAGEQIWVMHPLFDLVISKEQADKLPPAARNFLLLFAYPHPFQPEALVLDADDGRFMNHRDEPNTRFLAEVGFAISRIDAGEEITCNYLEFYPAGSRARFPFLSR